MEPSFQTANAHDRVEAAAAAAQAGTGAGLPPADDPLLEAIVWLCGHYGIERTPESLMACLASGQALTPTLAVRILREGGFNAGLVHRHPRKVLTLLLPVVLLLNNGDACILTDRIAPTKKGEPVRYKLVLPGSEDMECEATEQELLASYSGFALLATPRNADTETATDGPALVNGGHWLWGTLKRFVPYYRQAMVAALLSNVLMLATGLFTSVVYDRVIPHQAITTLWALAIGAIVAVGFDLLARQLRGYLIDLAGKKADLALGSILFKQTLGIRLENRPESAGSFAHHLQQIETVREFAASATLSTVTDLPFIALFIGMTFFIAGPVGWVLVLAVPVVLGICWGIQHVLRRLMSSNMRQHANLHGVLIEAVEGLEDLRAAGAQGHFQQRYEQTNAAAAQSSLQARALSGWVNNFAMVSQQLVTVIMMVWGVHLIADKQLTGGALIAAVMFAGRAIAPLGSVVSLASRYQGARAALTALNQLMSLPVVREPGKRYMPCPRVNGAMALREVGFAYPQGAHQLSLPVLKAVSLAFQPGERVAILGRIGSGKSTILRLLGGLYQPTEGFVEIDGIDLRQLDPADFRAQVGFVSQEPRLFQGTLKDNILLGRPAATPEQLLAVSRLTGLDKMAAAHPMGFDLPVGEQGSQLSGGQRQLVALARCLVTQPRILLMDEPTSSMDAQSEIAFIQQLRAAAEGRTLVVVTHRPALLEIVNRIVVVDGGRVVANGPKDQVLAALAGRPAQQAAPQQAAPQAAQQAPQPAQAPQQPPQQPPVPPVAQAA